MASFKHRNELRNNNAIALYCSRDTLYNLSDVLKRPHFIFNLYYTIKLGAEDNNLTIYNTVTGNNKI